MIPEQQELDRYRMALDPYRRVVVGVVVRAARPDRRRRPRPGSGAPGCCGATARPFGEKDPQFGKDISFFAFDLPWYRFVLGFALRDRRAVA